MEQEQELVLVVLEPLWQLVRVQIRLAQGLLPGLVVQALARPEWLVEIDATAVIPD